MDSDTPPAAKAPEPTLKEAFLMLSVLNNMEGKPKVNWDGVAEATGLKNGSVAATRFGQVKRRLGWAAPAKAASSTSSTSRVTKSRARARTNNGRKNARAAEADEDNVGHKGEETAVNVVKTEVPDIGESELPDVHEPGNFAEDMDETAGS